MGGQVHRHANIPQPPIQPLPGLTAGALQHQFADRGNQAGFFRQGNELGRRQQAHGRVLPAHERFHR